MKAFFRQLLHSRRAFLRQLLDSGSAFIRVALNHIQRFHILHIGFSHFLKISVILHQLVPEALRLLRIRRHGARLAHPVSRIISVIVHLKNPPV